MYRTAESLYCMPKINTTLCVSYTGIKFLKKGKKKKGIRQKIK